MRLETTLIALGLGAGFLFAASSASAKTKPVPPPLPNPQPPLSDKVKALLASRGYEGLPSFVMTVSLDAVTLVPLADGAKTALSWADAHKASGHSVVVPVQFVDGKKRPYGDVGLPQNVLAVSAKDAKSLTDSGLFVEYGQ